MVTEIKDSIICIVAICHICRQAVIYKYTRAVPASGIPFTAVTTNSGTFLNFTKPPIEWCDCSSDEPRFLCKVTNEELPGLEDKCEKCKFKFSCASSRIEVIYNGKK